MRSAPHAQKLGVLFIFSSDSSVPELSNMAALCLLICPKSLQFRSPGNIVIICFSKCCQAHLSTFRPEVPYFSAAHFAEGASRPVTSLGSLEIPLDLAGS